MSFQTQLWWWDLRTGEAPKASPLSWSQCEVLFNRLTVVWTCSVPREMPNTQPCGCPLPVVVMGQALVVRAWTQSIHGVLVPRSPNTDSTWYPESSSQRYTLRSFQTVEDIIFRMPGDKGVQKTLRKLAGVILQCKNLMHSFSYLTVFKYIHDLAAVLLKFWSLFLSFTYFFLWKLIPLAD